MAVGCVSLRLESLSPMRRARHSATTLQTHRARREHRRRRRELLMLYRHITTAVDYQIRLALKLEDIKREAKPRRGKQR